ncbi:helix-turn-helix domain-containing protein [Bradyrhizobium valentinum]|uniref:helix-turn-helix domain-containing protein n=1 Tax=Bradyrhizobium valentinum TaxID=1518501 RepID=UPI0009EBC0F7
MKLGDAAAHLEALGNPTHLKIYRALVRAGEAGMPVGKLQDRLKIAPSTLSHHMNIFLDQTGPWSIVGSCPNTLLQSYPGLRS